MKKMYTVLSVLLAVLSVARGESYQWDDNGYVLYCPCMGEPF